MPLVQAATTSERWVRLATFAVGGAISSVLVASVIALVGRALVPSHASWLAPVSLGVALLSLAREGGAPVPLPQLRRQTQRIWAMRLPAPVVPALWGLDVGLFFSTRITWLGAWLVPALALIGGDGAWAVGLFLAYWCGRTSAVLIAPVLAPRAGTAELLGVLDASHASMRYVYLATLLVVIAVSVE